MLAVAERADAGVLVAVVGDVHDQLRRLAAHERAGRLEAAARGGLAQQPVHDRRVRGVDAAFQPLQPVALLDHLGDVAMRFRRLRPGEFRQRRHVLHRAEIGPDDAAQLGGRIRGEAHLVLEVVLFRLVHHVDAGAGHVELPAVIDAAQAAFFVAPEEQRRAAVRAEFVDQADAAVRCRGTRRGPRRAAGRGRAGRRVRRLRATAARASSSGAGCCPWAFPAPTRVTSSLSSRDSMADSSWWFGAGRGMARLGLGGE